MSLMAQSLLKALSAMSWKERVPSEIKSEGERMSLSQMAKVMLGSFMGKVTGKIIL